jgi:hypothetical protein
MKVSVLRACLFVCIYHIPDYIYFIHIFAAAIVCYLAAYYMLLFV